MPLSPSCSALDKMTLGRSQLPGLISAGVPVSLGSQIDDVIANRMKTTPPISVTRTIRNYSEKFYLIESSLPVRTEIF